MAKEWWDQDRSHKTEWGKIKPDKRSNTPKYWAGEPVGKDKKGNTVYRGAGQSFTSRKKANDWLTKRRFERDGERAMSEAAKIDGTFGHWLEIWYNGHKKAYQEEILSENGWKAYENSYRNWLVRIEVDGKPLADYKMRKIDVEFCKKIQVAVRRMRSLKTGKLSPASAHKAEMNIYSVCKLAADQGAVPSNPWKEKAVKVSNYDPSREIGELSEAAIDDLIDNTPPEYKAAIYMWAYVGLRAGECWGLQVRDLYLDNRRVAINRQLCATQDRLIRDTDHVYEGGHAHPVGVCLQCRRDEDGNLPREIEFGTRIRKGVVLRPPKTGREKTLDLHPFVVDALREHLELRKPQRPDDWLFVDQHARRAGRGLPVNHVNWYGYHFKPVVRMLEWDDKTDVHTLRHFCGAYHLMLGYPSYVVQRMLDHSSEEMTKRYSHLMKGSAAMYHDKAQEAWEARHAS